MWSNFKEFLVLCNWTQTVQIRHRHLGALAVPLLASSAILFSVGFFFFFPPSFQLLLCAVVLWNYVQSLNGSWWSSVQFDEILGAWLAHGSRLKLNCWSGYYLELLGLPFWWRLLPLGQGWWHGSWTGSARSCPVIWELLLWSIKRTWKLASVYVNVSGCNLWQPRRCFLTVLSGCRGNPLCLCTGVYGGGSCQPDFEPTHFNLLL